MMFSFFNKPLQIIDFPRKSYEVYWEIFPYETLDGDVREVRLIGYDGSQKEVKVFTAPTAKAVDKKVQEFLSVTMKKYKRV